MAQKKIWYLDIGKNHGNAGTYVRIEIFHDEDSDGANDASSGRVEVVAESNGVQIYDLTRTQIEKFRIKFIKRRYDGFRFDINTDSDGPRKELLELKFKGGDVNSTRAKEKENILQLGVNIAHWLSQLTTGQFGVCNFDYRVYVYENNSVVKSSAGVGLSTPTNASLESEYLSSGDDGGLAQEAAPYADVGNGESMFPNDFYFDYDEGFYYQTIEEQGEQEEDALSPQEGGTISEIQELAVPADIPVFEGTPSEIYLLQKDPCESILEPDIAAGFAERRICPTCIPNDNYTPPDWWDWDRNVPWLNEKTCQYNIVISNPDSELTTNEYEELVPAEKEIYNTEVIRKGLIDILNYYNKVVTDDILCANPPQSAAEECGPRIPQEILDNAVYQQQIGSGQNDGTTMTLFGVDIENLLDIPIRNPLALELYAKIQNYASSVRLTTGAYDNNRKPKFQVTIPATLVQSLPDDLLAQQSEDAQPNPSENNPNNEFVVVIKGSEAKQNLKRDIPNAFKRIAEYHAFFYHTQGGRLRINTTFDLENPDNIPFYTSQFRKKFRRFYSELKELLELNSYNLRNFDEAFRQAYEIKIIFQGTDNPTNPYTIKKVKARYLGCPFKTCSVGLSAFINKYATEQTLMGYVSNYSNIVRSIDPFPPWLDFLVEYTRPQLTILYGNPSNAYEAQGCLDNAGDSYADIAEDLIHDIELGFSKALEYGLNSLNCRTLKTYQSQEYGLAIAESLNELGENPEIVKILANYKSFGQSVKGEVGVVSGAVQKAFKKMLRDKQQPQRSFFERMTGKTAAEMLQDIKSNPKESVGELLNKINPCNWEALSLDLVLCMMKGMQPIDVLRRTAKALLGNLEPIRFEKVFIGLPNDVQREVEAQIIEVIGELQSPWEFAKRNKTPFQNPNTYETQNDPPENPQDPSQVSADDKKSIEEMGQDKKALKEEITQLEDEIRSKREDFKEYEEKIQRRDELTVELDALIKSGIQGAFTILKIDGLEGEINILNNEIQQLESSIDEQAELEAELRTKKLALNSTKLAIINQIIEEGGEPSQYDKAAQQIIKILGEAYIDLIVDLLSVDQLKELVDSLPGSDIFIPIVAAASCPQKELFQTWSNAAFAGLDINPCQKSDWNIPPVPEIPQMQFLRVLKNLLEEFLKKLVERVIAAMVAFLIRTLQRTVDGLCDIFEGIGSFMLQNQQDEGSPTGSLFDAIADAFCRDNLDSYFGEDGGANSGQDTFNDLFQQWGSFGRVPKDRVIEWGNDLSETATVNMWRELFVTGVDVSSDGSRTAFNIVDAAWEVTQQYPEISEFFPDKAAFEAWINDISNAIPSNVKFTIETALDSLSNDEGYLAEVCRLFCLRDETNFEEIVDVDQNQFLQSYEDLLNGLLRGPDQAIIDALDDTSQLFGNDPYCEDIRDLYNSENLTGRQPLLREPEYITELRKQLTDSIFEDIEIAYTKDLIASPDAFFNNVLADRNNDKLSHGTLFDPAHQTKVKSRFLWPNAADTFTQFNNKWKTAKFPLRLVMRIADQFREEVKRAQEISEDDQTGFSGKIKEFFSGFFSRSFKRFIALFKGQPAPTNLLPQTVGIDYISGLGRVAPEYKSRPNLKRVQSIISANKSWTSLGFDSLSVATTIRKTKKPDIELVYETKEKDYSISAGFSPYTLTDGKIDFRETQKYSITAEETVYARPKLANLVDEDGNFVKTSENGTAFSILERLATLTDPPVPTIEMVNYIEVPYDISRYQTRYDRYLDFYETTMGPSDTYTLSSLNDHRDAAEFSDDGYLLAAPINRFALHAFIKERNLGDINDVFRFEYFTDVGPVNEYYSSRNNTDRIVQDLVRTFRSALSRAGQENVERQIAQGTIQETVQGQGFQYGFNRKSKIEFTDLLYVNPNADPKSPETWVYTYDNEQKVLGKSATENPRVVFLDPDIYGGTYKNPKVYIKPARHRGVLGAMQYFLPEDDGCEPSNDIKLFLRQIKAAINDIERSSTADRRLSYDPDCVREPPFDLVADASSHAYIHGIVLLTTRTYILEVILRTLPMFLNLGPNPENYDSAISYFVLDNMEKGLKDTPTNNGFKRYARDTYWYLFLEQMVQTAQREILRGSIQKDEKLTELFDELVQVRRQFYQIDKNDKKVLRRIRRVKWRENGNVEQIIGTQEIPAGYRQIIVDIIQSVAFNAFGPNFRQYVKGKELKFHAGRLLTLKQLRRYMKIYTIWQNEELAKEIASYVVFREIKNYMNLFNEEFGTQTEIASVTKYAINPKSLLSYGPENLAGIAEYDAQEVVPNEIYGDVLDLNTQYAFEEFVTNKKSDGFIFDQAQGAKTGFFLQKYVKVFVNDRTPENLRAIFEPYSGKEISVELYQTLLQEYINNGNVEWTPETYISDLFGSTVIEEDGYRGTSGIRFGVKLSLASPHLGNIEQPGYNDRKGLITTEELHPILDELNEGYVNLTYDTSDDDYVSVLESQLPENVKLRTVKLTSYEQDVSDWTIQQYVDKKLLLNSCAGEVLKCYIDRLCETEDFRYIMEYLFPLKQVSSMLLINSYYGYINSIGEDETEREETIIPPDEEWKSKILSNTKERLRSLFSSYYDAREINKEKGQTEKHSKEFRKLNIPAIDLNIDFSSIRWWQRKRFHERPFNKNDQECMEGALGSFNQNLPEDQSIYIEEAENDDSAFSLDATEPVQTETIDDQVFEENYADGANQEAGESFMEQFYESTEDEVIEILNEKEEQEQENLEQTEPASAQPAPTSAPAAPEQETSETTASKGTTSELAPNAGNTGPNLIDPGRTT